MPELRMWQRAVPPLKSLKAFASSLPLFRDSKRRQKLGVASSRSSWAQRTTRCPFRVWLKRSVTEAGSNLTRAEQIEPHSLRRRSGRTIRDQGEVRDFVKRNRRTVTNHVHERRLRCGTYTRLRFIGACGIPAAVRGHLRRTRRTFALAALHAIHRCCASEPACRAKLDKQYPQQQHCQRLSHNC